MSANAAPSALPPCGGDARQGRGGYTPTIHMIAAIGRRGQAGLGGRLPWHDPADLAFFRRMTMGGVVVAGARTEMPDLSGRIKYRYTRSNTPKGLVDLIGLQYPGWPIWIAGGPATWRAFAPLINGLRLISLVDYDGAADAWFPFEDFGMSTKRHTMDAIDKVEITLPEYVCVCPHCKGTGETLQTWVGGCGRPTYRMAGSCQLCGKYSRYGQPGPGYVYAVTAEPVPPSVLAQIETARKSHG